MKTFVSEADIAKHYKGGFERYSAYRRFQELKDGVGKNAMRESSRNLGFPPWTVSKWLKGKLIPHSVKCNDFLMERGFVPLTEESPTINTVAYLLGLNWPAGGLVHFPETGQSHFVQFSLNEPLYLDRIAEAFNMELGSDKRRGKRRYRLQSHMAIYFAELSVPKNGSKAKSNIAYPSFIDDLVAIENRDAVALFLGAQVLQAKKFDDGYDVRLSDKKDVTDAKVAASRMYRLYDRTFPDVDFETPGFRKDRYSKPSAIDMTLSEESYDKIRDWTKTKITDEIVKIEALQPIRELPID